MITPLADPIAEGRRIITQARERQLDIYLIGGVAVRLATPSGTPPLVDRAFGDLDVIATRQAGKAMVRFFSDIGYTPDREFNAVNGRSRMLFRDAYNGRDLDVLIGEFVMCHALPILECADPAQLTIPPTDLLLTKLQIVELTTKDLTDIYNLLHAWSVNSNLGHHERHDGIDATRIAQLCAGDWGLWRTVTSNLTRVSDPQGAPAVSEREHGCVSGRATALLEAIRSCPKSRRWRLRDRVGDRVRWYDEPEEAH